MDFFGSVSKSIMSSWPGSSDTSRYTNAAQHVIELGHYLLHSEKYTIDREDRFEQANTKTNTNTPKGPLSSIRLKISLCCAPTEIGSDEKEEINIKFLQELKSKLTGLEYALLIANHGKLKEDGSYYFIDLNLKGLSKLSSKLNELSMEVSKESGHEKAARENAYKDRKEQYEIKVAEEKVHRARLTRANSVDASRSGTLTDSRTRFNSADQLLKINAKFRNSQKRLSVAMGGVEFRSLMAQQATTFPHIAENFESMYVIYRSYRDALDSDDEFKLALNRKYPDKTIGKIKEDTDLLLACFIYYLDGDPDNHSGSQAMLKGNLDYQITIRKIFGNPDRIINRAKYEGYVKCSESIEQFSNQTANNVEMSGKMEKALQACYGYIDAQEKKYTEPTECLIDASHFKLGYPHLTYEAQFENVDQETKTVSGPLASVRLAVSLHPNGTIRNETDFDNYIASLKKLLGAERFNRLVLSNDQTRVPTDKEGQTFYLYLDPVELQKITLEELMPDLSPDDMQMYSTMRGESVTNEVSQVKVDQVAQMNKNFLAMYEIYAKFKLSTSPEGTKVAFASDPVFLPNTELAMTSQANFIKYVKENDQCLKTIRQIFDSKKPGQARIKYDKYLNECQMKIKFTRNNELIPKWYGSFEELVKCCGRVVNILGFRIIDKALPLIFFKKKNNIPVEVMNLIFDNLLALSAGDKSPTTTPDKSRTIRTSPVKSKTVSIPK